MTALLFIVLGISTGWAETGTAVPSAAPGQAAVPSSAPRIPGGPGSSFDDRVFNVGGPADREYTSEDQQRWLETCSPKKEADPQGYRECYQEQKKKTLEDVNRQRVRVQGGQGLRGLSQDSPLVPSTK